MVGEAAGREPAAPVLGGRVDAVESLLGRLGRPGSAPQASAQNRRSRRPCDVASSRWCSTREVQVAGEEQVRAIAIAAGDRRVTVVGESRRRRRGRSREPRQRRFMSTSPWRHSATLISTRSASRSVGAGACAGRRGGRATARPRARRAPAAIRSPSPRSSRERWSRGRSGAPPAPSRADRAGSGRRRGRAAPEDARGVEAARRATRPCLGSDQGGRVAIGEHRVVGDARKRRGRRASRDRPRARL